MDGWSTLARGVREQQLAAARREGVIEGLEWVMHAECEGDIDFLQFKIRAELERLRVEQREQS